MSARLSTEGKELWGYHGKNGSQLWAGSLIPLSNLSARALRIHQANVLGAGDGEVGKMGPPPPEGAPIGGEEKLNTHLLVT